MSQSSRIRRWWRRAKREGWRSPLGAAAAVTGVVALALAAIPLIGSAQENAASDEIDVQAAPLVNPRPPATNRPSATSSALASAAQPSSSSPDNADALPPWEEIVGQLTSPTFVIPKSLEEIERPPATAGAGSVAFTEWAIREGGVYASEMGIAFTVRGETPDLSLITGLRIEIVEREEPLEGTWLAPDGAGGEPNRLLVIDLDSTPISYVYGGPETWSFPLSVSSSDLEYFSIVVGTKTCHCSWVAVLEYQDSDGDAREIRIDDDGRPFQITAPSNATAQVYAPRTDDEPWPAR